jgi:MarR family transcriptional regulator, lower aerobic nicotinate degradation pathway regulator
MARSTRHPNDDAKDILNRIRQLVRTLRSFEKEAQARYGIGAAQMFILHILQHEDKLSPNDLADRTATDQSSVSLAVRKLVEQGYVKRTPSADDRRQVELSLTPKGKSVVRRSPPAVQERLMSSVARMPAAERSQLVRLLDRLLTGLVVDTGSVPMLFQDDLGLSAPRRRRK